MAGEVEVSIVTVPDIFQDEAGRRSKFSEEYRNRSAVIILDRQDLLRLGAKEGDRLLIKSDAGSAVVAAKAAQDDVHPGLAFMYRSPWSNQLLSDEICTSSTPGFKGIRATVQPAESNVAGVTEISEIFSRIRA